VDRFEIDSQTARWRTFRHGPILLRWPKITRSRSRLNPISRAVTVSAGRFTRTDSLAIIPPSRTPQDARPLPVLRRRWRSRLPTGGRPDDRSTECPPHVQCLKAPLRRSTHHEDASIAWRSTCRSLTNRLANALPHQRDCPLPLPIALTSYPYDRSVALTYTLAVSAIRKGNSAAKTSRISYTSASHVRALQSATNFVLWFLFPYWADTAR